MEISYNRLFKLLIDKGMKKTELAKIAGLTPGTLAKLSKNQTVSMDSLIKICTTLNCSFDDIVEIINNEE
jgi:putative transcriptional regulator